MDFSGSFRCPARKDIPLKKKSPKSDTRQETLLPAWLKKKVLAVNPKRPRIKKNENR
jgi:hypothetical protein